uniref:Protein kinase domain-containing protein n=1 Tax=Kalanchoe fedtschenkoi TaxID=63787 RepID=A0A7N1A470_KALFE
MERVGARERRESFLPLQLLVVILTSLGLGASRADELRALTAFRAAAALPDWNSSAPFCSWGGITCREVAAGSFRVTRIDLPGRNLTGKLAAEIFTNLSFLESVDLSNNSLVGDIPAAVFSCASLRHLNMSSNNLTGPVPPVAVTGLETLDLANNALTGEIPVSVGLFAKLKYIDIGGNLLSGKVPETLANMTSLEVLILAGNQLVGRVPSGLRRMKKLRFLYLGYNYFSGEIPGEIGELSSLSHLDLVFNNLTGSIPWSVGNLTNLKYLFLYQNRFTGSIPESLYGLNKLVSLDLSDNSLSGGVPELLAQLEELEILQLFSNKFSGKIPTAVARLPRLRVLQLWDNKFTGEIPGELGKRSNLTVLDLSTNFLTEAIPEHLCRKSQLSKLILFSNSLRGEIPKGLSRCRTLSRVRLENNSLSGEVPGEFWKLPLVYYLDVSGNKLSGLISEVKWDMPSLMVAKLGRNKFSGGLPESFGSEVIQTVDLSGNDLSGAIPGSFGNLSKLVQLRLGDNKLSGSIPGQLSFCSELVYLDLSRNQLSGQIPPSISALEVLSELDLSENELSGEIPPSLCEMDSLVKVNVSHNHLHGSLPQGGPFLAIEASAVGGNDLCDPRPKTNGLRRCTNPKSRTQWWIFVFGAVIALLLMVLVFSLVVFIRRRNGLEPRRVESEDGLWEVQFFDAESSKSITIDDILSREHSVVARGANWSSYKGKSKKSGREFMVTHWSGLSSFSTILWTALTELGRARNQQAVKMIGICRSEIDGCLILHECGDGSRKLCEILHSMGWSDRMKLARGLAKALQAVHSCTNVPIIDLCPEMITVDDDSEPYLHILLPGVHDSKPDHDQALNSPSRTALSSVAESKREDVYSFGIILIVLVSGRFPSDSKLGPSQKTIAEWARDGFSDPCNLAWMDRRMAETVVRGELEDVMKLGLRCAAKDPAERPSAAEVYKMLDSIEQLVVDLYLEARKDSWEHVKHSSAF